MKNIEILNNQTKSKRINKYKGSRSTQSTKYPINRIYDFNVWMAYINEQVIINSFNHCGSL